MTNRFTDQDYMQLCSEKTLQTNKEGFFLQFANALAENVGEKWIKNVFGKLKTDRERIRKIYEDHKIKDYVIEFLSNVQEVYRKKCAETALKSRLEAEKCFKNEELTKSLSLFSQSVLRAPQESENIALSLLGRARTLMKIEELQNALADLQLCLKETLPDDLRAEAFFMMSLCCRALGEDKRAKVALGLAEKLDRKVLMLEDDFLGVKAKEGRVVRVPVVENRHKELVNASGKIEVKSSDSVGRYIVASKEIKTGETLVVEPAYASCLIPEKFGTHCHHCYERLLSPIGCPHCSAVAFCKPECRAISLSTYHRYECKYLDLLIGSGMSVLSHTALRTITQNPLEKSLETYRKRDSFYDLCTNSARRGPADFLQRALMAAFLLRCLQKSGYFPKINDAVVPTEEEYRIGEMLLTGLQILQFNAHEIYETLCSKENRLRGSKISYIGVAVYPTVALFNHDCYPAVTRHFVGKHIVITAIRPLGVGDVVQENYGPIFTCRKLIERQRSLSARYWFNCECRACLEDWPTSDPNTRQEEQIRCPNKNCQYVFTKPASKSPLACPLCKQEVSLTENIDKLRWCEQEYKLGMKYVEDGERDKAIKVLCTALDTFHSVAAPPHKETHKIQEVLRRCLADSGNVVVCNMKK